MVNKGYSSQSAMYESSKRFIEAGESGQSGIIFYLGDHDPSGEDMVRDIEDRMEMFGADLIVKKLALTWKQIEEYSPPPNPAKISDPRAAEYIRKHGNESWEVDALEPKILARLVTHAFSAHIDQEKSDAIIEREE